MGSCVAEMAGHLGTLELLRWFRLALILSLTEIDETKVCMKPPKKRTRQVPGTADDSNSERALLEARRKG